MRRAIPALLVLSCLAACSELFLTVREGPAAALELDAETPERRFRARVCWTSEDFVDDVSLGVRAWAPAGADGRVTVEIDGEQPWSITAVAPSHDEVPRRFWWPDLDQPIDGACSEGVGVRFTLDDPDAGPVTVEWTVFATLSASTGDQQTLDALPVTLQVEPE